MQFSLIQSTLIEKCQRVNERQINVTIFVLDSNHLLSLFKDVLLCKKIVFIIYECLRRVSHYAVDSGMTFPCRGGGLCFKLRNYLHCENKLRRKRDFVIII